MFYISKVIPDSVSEEVIHFSPTLKGMYNFVSEWEEMEMGAVYDITEDGSSVMSVELLSCCGKPYLVYEVVF